MKSQLPQVKIDRKSICLQLSQKKKKSTGYLKCVSTPSFDRNLKVTESIFFKALPPVKQFWYRQSLLHWQKKHHWLKDHWLKNHWLKTNHWLKDNWLKKIIKSLLKKAVWNKVKIQSGNLKENFFQLDTKSLKFHTTASEIYKKKWKILAKKSIVV